MKYYEKIDLKNGKTAIIRNGEASDGEAVLRCFKQLAGETDNLLTYPDEITFTPESEGEFLKSRAESCREVLLLAFLDGRVVGTAGISALGTKYKISHRAEFSVSVCKDCWGLGIGSALTKACIALAKNGGYSQLNLTVVGSNERAMALYKSVGFAECGRNPKGFQTRTGDFQETVEMLLDLQ